MQPTKTMQKDRLNNPKYVNWIKAGTALHYVKEGLTDFANEHSKRLYDKIKSNVQQKCGSALISVCSSCCSKSFQKKRDKSRPISVYKWSINCASNVCNHWLDAIVSYHSSKCPHVYWVNVDPTLWSSDSWEVMKTFQPLGCRLHKHAGDCDCSALLTLFLECTYFHQFLTSLQPLRDIKEHRNDIMHSGSLEIEDTVFANWMDKMIELLEDPRHFNNLSQCKESVKKIIELKTKPLEIAECKQLEVQAIRQITDDLKKDIQRLQTQQETLSHTNDLKKVQDELAHIQAQLQQCINMSSRIERIEDILRETHEFGEIKDQLEELTAKFNKNSIQLSVWKTQMETGMTHMATQMIQVRSQLDKNAEEIVELRKHKVQDKQPTMDVAEVRQNLLDMYMKNCDEVLLYPLSPEWTGKLHSLYVKPYMLVHPRQSGLVQRKVVTSYHDVFYSSRNSSISRNIYIVGDAGIGKSTFCDYMVHAWCCAYSGIEGYHSSIDIQTMKSFPLLFYISLRCSSPGQSIEEMIIKQLEIDINVPEVLTENCLILLDGLDEWTADSIEQSESRFRKTVLPKMSSGCTCTVVTTSRPWKLECLDLTCSHVDREIHIHGLDESATTKLAERLISALNNIQQNNKNAQDFIGDMQVHNIEHFLKIPILLKQMICLWHDGKELGKSQCEIYTNVIKRQLQLARQTGKVGDVLYGNYSSPTMCQLPPFLNSLTDSETYQQLLFALSKMAFHTLFSKRRESALVFEHNVTRIHGMTDPEVKACLKLGLLSQKQLHGTITERNKSLNFIHKSNQEFFAAVYLSSCTDAIQDVFYVCKTLQTVQDIEQLVHFVSGMNTEVCKELLVHLQTVASADRSLKQYRENAEGKSALSYHLLLRLQRTVLELITESAKNDKHDIRLPITDLIIDKTTIEQVSSKFNNLELSKLASVHILTSKEMSQELQSECRSILERLCHLKDVRKIIVEDPARCLGEDSVQALISNSRKGLTSLQLYSIDFARLQPTSGWQRWISGTPFYTMLQKLSVRSLSLEDVFCTSEQLLYLSRNLSNTNDLRELHLRGKPFAVYNKKCALDLRSHTHIEHMSLRDLHLDTIRISSNSLESCSIGHLSKPGCTRSILACIDGAPMLRHLECERFRHSEDIDALVCVLPTLEMLETVVIRETNFEDRSVTLAPRMKNLRKVRFYKVNMVIKALKHLLDKLPPQKVRVELDMVNLIASKEDPHVPDYIRHSSNYSVINMAKVHNDDNKWLIRFDKLETEDTSGTWM